MFYQYDKISLYTPCPHIFAKHERDTHDNVPIVYTYYT